MQKKVNNIHFSVYSQDIPENPGNPGRKNSHRNIHNVTTSPRTAENTLPRVFIPPARKTA
jgi:hypothetical protein